MISLVIMRHAQAEHNVRRLFNSDPKAPSYFVSNLTDEGRRVVQETARELLQQGICDVAALYHSPLPRTTQTAEILCAEGVASCAVMRPDSRFFEVQALEHEGKEIDFVGEWGGESLESIYRRVSNWFDEVVQSASLGNLVVVTHGTPASQLLKRVSGEAAKFRPGEAKIVRFNPQLL